MNCVRHPRVETWLRCGKCDKPICAKCTVYGPAGVRCRECAGFHSSPLYQVAPIRIAGALAVGYIAGIAAGYAGALAEPMGVFIQLWIGVIAGYVAGEAILRSIERKRGPIVEAVAASSVGLGGISGALLRAVGDAGGIAMPGTSFSVGVLVAIGIATVCAWSRMRL
jgi:hypothetical protein